VSETGLWARRPLVGRKLHRVLRRLAAVVALTGAVLALILAAGPGGTLSLVTAGGPLTLRLDDRPEIGSLSSGCDPDGVSLRYETVFTPAGYAVSAVTVTDVDATACAHKTILVVLTDADRAVLGQGSATVPPHDADLRLPITGAPSAAATTGTAVTIG
jgi:hypothetical protein